jgi:opacity protein-like surface antigen
MGPIALRKRNSATPTTRGAASGFGTTRRVGLGRHGQINRYALMTNAICDFTVGWPVTPHIGVGIGAVNLHNSSSGG